MRIITCGLLALFLTGCGSAESQLCDRLDECNALDGMSVEECTEVWADTLDELSSSEAHDCEDDLKDCLDNESCDNFLSCDVGSCF